MDPIDFSNPASPLSPLNPANPCSPLSSFNPGVLVAHRRAQEQLDAQLDVWVCFVLALFFLAVFFSVLALYDRRERNAWPFKPPPL